MRGAASRSFKSPAEYNLHFRQLIHVSFKVAAGDGCDRYLEALEANGGHHRAQRDRRIFTARHIVPHLHLKRRMKTFLTENFLLETEVGARALLQPRGATQPIYDYHCHLAPKQIAENYRFRNLYDIWLAGDHYKWRAMRANGVAERFCTGDATRRGKVPGVRAHRSLHAAQSALSLEPSGAPERYFGIDDLINEESASSPSGNAPTPSSPRRS